MLEHVVPVPALGVVVTKAVSKEVNALKGDIDAHRNYEIASLQVLLELRLGPALERTKACEQLEENSPQRPNVSPVVVVAVVEDLWRHVHNCAAMRLHHLVLPLHYLRKTQVANLEFVAVNGQFEVWLVFLEILSFDQYVCQFQIAVHYFLLYQVAKTFDQLPHNHLNFKFWKRVSPVLQKRSHVAAVAILSEYVCVVY